MAIKVLCLLCQQIQKTQQWPQDWKRSILILISKKSSSKEFSKHSTVSLITRASKTVLKILHVRLQHYQNWELSNIQAGFRKGKGKKRSNHQHLLAHRESKGIPEKHLPSCFTDYTKAFDYVDHNKLLKRYEHQTILSVSWETHMWVKKQHLELYMEQLIGSGLRN